MIEHFRHKGLKRLFQQGEAEGISRDLFENWRVIVRAHWRVIFRFEEGDAYDVDLIDYH